MVANIIIWAWNNKMLSMSLIALIIVSIMLGFARSSLYVKSKQLDKQASQIAELILQNKEQAANLAVLKIQADRMNELRSNGQQMQNMINNLPETVKRKLRDEEINSVNNCLADYFNSNGVLPKGCGDTAQ